jgi:hypothetical protein
MRTCAHWGKRDAEGTADIRCDGPGAALNEERSGVFGLDLDHANVERVLAGVDDLEGQPRLLALLDVTEPVGRLERGRAGVGKRDLELAAVGALNAGSDAPATRQREREDREQGDQLSRLHRFPSSLGA